MSSQSLVTPVAQQTPDYTLCLLEDSLLVDWSHGTVLSAAMMVALKRVEQDNNCIGCPNN